MLFFKTKTGDKFLQLDEPNFTENAVSPLLLRARAQPDEYNLNVVDCNASVTVARRSISVSGGLVPPAASVKWFSVASPGPAGIFFFPISAVLPRRASGYKYE